MINLITNDRINQIYEWCCEIYLKHGHIFRFPKNTNPHDTYQWKYLKSLAIKLEQYGLDDFDAKEFIEMIVEYSKQNNLLHKGLSVFQQANIVGICYDRLTKLHNNSDRLLSSLRSIKEWLDNQIGDNDAVRILIKRRNINSLSNIVIWYESGKISEAYFSLSKYCSRSYSSLQSSGRSDCDFLPNPSRCYLLRNKLTQDSTFVQRAQLIFGNDWRTPCR